MCRLQAETRGENLRSKPDAPHLTSLARRYCPVFKEIGAKYGPFDLCAIPVGAYEPRWFVRAPEMAIAAPPAYANCNLHP